MSRYSLRILPLIAMLLSLFVAAVPAQANVDLSYFRVAQGSGPAKVLVQWATETETDTAAFIIRRGVSSDFAQGADIQTVQATGTAVGGKAYEFEDSGVTAGQKYYYWLIEFTTGGERNQLGAVQEITPGAAATTPPTATVPAATATVPAATATVPAATAPPQATQPPAANDPTATTAAQPLVQNTAPAVNTPIPAATTPPVNPPAAATTAAPVNPVITTPDSAPAAVDTPLIAVDPAATVAVDAERREEQAAEASPAALGETPAVKGQSLNSAERPSGETTPSETTPQALAEAAPAQEGAPQAQLLRPTATPRPSDASDSSASSNSLLLVIGGGSVCGAALLALAVFFVWRRH